MSSDRNPPAEEDRETGLAVPAGDMSEWAEALVAQARTDGVELTGEGGLLTGLIRQVLQTGLEVEMADHLGYDRYWGTTGIRPKPATQIRWRRHMRTTPLHD
ncbi:MAG: hypothetical protein GY722_03005 [bacterium]|nr:hypothetical protein [bacterium]